MHSLSWPVWFKINISQKVNNPPHSPAAARQAVSLKHTPCKSRYAGGRACFEGNGSAIGTLFMDAFPVKTPVACTGQDGDF